MMCLGVCFFGWMTLSAQSSPSIQARLAGLEQDVKYLRRQIGALRIEMEGLMRENQALRQTIADQNAGARQEYVTLSEFNRTLRSLQSELERAGIQQKDAIISLVSAQVEKLAEQTQTALGALAKSIEGRPQVPQVVTFSDNYPKSGINYTVQSGDSLGKIAREHNSRIQWIRDANRLATDLIYPNQELFIPQEN